MDLKIVSCTYFILAGVKRHDDFKRFFGKTEFVKQESFADEKFMSRNFIITMLQSQVNVSDGFLQNKSESLDGLTYIFGYIHVTYLTSSKAIPSYQPTFSFQYIKNVCTYKN